MDHIDLIPALFPKITNLDLQCCYQFKDEDFSHLRLMQNLTILNIRGLENITDDGFAGTIPYLTKLKRLNMRGMSEISDEGIEAISSLVDLESLDISWCNVKVYGIGALSNLVNLKELVILKSNYVYLNTICRLTVLSKLEHLNLSECETVNNICLKEIIKFPMLKNLDLSGCWAIGKMIESFVGSLDNLRRLNISNLGRVNDEILNSVSYLPLLKELNVSKTGVKMEGLGLLLANRMRALKMFYFV